MHSWMWWLIVGLVAGVLAKAVTPGTDREPKGCVMTVLLGIAGSVVMGGIMHLLFGANPPGGLGGTIVGATIGAVILISALRKFWK